MEEKNRKILFIWTEVICLTILIPIFYWATTKLILIPIGETFYHLSKERPFSPWFVVLGVLIIDIGWVILMRLFPKNEHHAKVILTILLFTLSASIISCFWILSALEGAF